MSNTKRPILPGTVQFIGLDIEGMVCVGITGQYDPDTYPEPQMFRVETDGANGFTIWDSVGDTDLTVELSESDPQLAVDLVEVARLILDENPTRTLALRLLPDVEPTDV